MHKQLLFLSLLLLLVGCEEDFPTYSSFCSSTKTIPNCLHYVIPNLYEKEKIQKAFQVPNDLKCKYRVELIKYHIGNCNNPIVKSTGSDMNGYVRIEIKKGFKCYYKVQSDYKNSEEEAFKRVLKQIEKEQTNIN